MYDKRYRRFLDQYNEYKHNIYEPFSDRNYTYFTDGKIFIRIKRIKSITRQNPLKGIFRTHIKPFLPKGEEKWVKIKVQHNQFDDLFSNPSVKWYNRRLSRRYVNLIRTLDDPMFAEKGEELEPVLFKFKQGIGLLMPMMQD